MDEIEGALERKVLSPDDPFGLCKEFRPDVGEAVSHITLGVRIARSDFRN